jgi:hypothetical protein
MKPEHVAELVKYRLEPAHSALDDAKFLLDNHRSPTSVVNRS